MSAPQVIHELVERFASNREAYASGAYNETQLRREFVDPFFGALGWDVENRQGFAEAYKDVIHEAAIKIGVLTKAPDYCFRIGGARKFFVETKKPLPRQARASGPRVSGPDSVPHVHRLSGAVGRDRRGVRT